MLVDEHLLNGRFTTPILDISKLIGQGGGGGRRVPQVPIEGFAKRVETVNGPLRIEGHFNQRRVLFIQRKNSASMPGEGGGVGGSDFKHNLHKNVPERLKLAIVLRTTNTSSRLLKIGGLTQKEPPNFVWQGPGGPYFSAFRLFDASHDAFDVINNSPSDSNRIIVHVSQMVVKKASDAVVGFIRSLVIRFFILFVDPGPKGILFVMSLKLTAIAEVELKIVNTKTLVTVFPLQPMVASFHVISKAVKPDVIGHGEIFLKIHGIFALKNFSITIIEAVFSVGSGCLGFIMKCKLVFLHVVWMELGSINASGASLYVVQ